jgi:hypothetical protein
MAEAPKPAPRSRPARKPRKPAARQHYGRQHGHLREQVLKKRPVCEWPGCYRFSEHAHHLVYPATTPADYMALCAYHHQEIHRPHK